MSDSSGETAEWLWSVKTAAFCAVDIVLRSVLGRYSAWGLCAKVEASAPTKESPAPVTFASASTGKAGKC